MKTTNQIKNKFINLYFKKGKISKTEKWYNNLLFTLKKNNNTKIQPQKLVDHAVLKLSKPLYLHQLTTHKYKIKYQTKIKQISSSIKLLVKTPVITEQILHLTKNDLQVNKEYFKDMQFHKPTYTTE